MKRTLTALTFLFAPLAAPVPSFSAFCQFSTSADGGTSGASYDIGSAYRASDCVVVARLSKGKGRVQPIEVTRVIKAPNAGSLTYSGQPESDRPVYEGVRLPAEREFLLLLRMKKAGVYGTVDDESTVCPNVFAITEGYANMGSQAVSVERLEHFFESKPDAIAYP